MMMTTMVLMMMTKMVIKITNMMMMMMMIKITKVMMMMIRITKVMMMMIRITKVMMMMTDRRWHWRLQSELRCSTKAARQKLGKHLLLLFETKTLLGKGQKELVLSSYQLETQFLFIQNCLGYLWWCIYRKLVITFFTMTHWCEGVTILSIY